MTQYIIAVVPAAARDSAESAIAPLLISPNAAGVHTLSVPLVPLPGNANATPPTAYGCCSPAGPLGVAALPQLLASIPGSAGQVVDPADYSQQDNWIEWLETLGLQPQVLSLPV